MYYENERRLVPPEAFEPVRCERSVAGRVLDIPMSQVSLQRPGIMTVIRQLVAAGASTLWAAIPIKLLPATLVHPGFLV